MEVEDGEDGALAGRGEGDADAPDAAPARPASASAITAIVLALGDAARSGQQRSDQTCGGVPGGGSTDDAAGSSSEGQQGSGTYLAGQVAVAGDGALVNIGKARKRAKKDSGSCVSVQGMARSIREWVIHKPPRAKHSACWWAFKYKNPSRHNPAGYEHQALWRFVEGGVDQGSSGGQSDRV